MDSGFEDNLVGCEPEEARIAPEISRGSRADVRAARLSPSSPSTSSPKKSRKSVQKRVVSVPIADQADASRPKGAGEGAPPSDSWAWRKYGQKPIKGSPYPRGYYRCSSSKGCPARKQVERSRVDPTMLVITYSYEHNHPWPPQKNHHHHHHQHSTSSANPSPKLPSDEEPAPLHPSPPDPSDQEEKYSDLVADDSSLMMADEFGWFSDVGSPSSTPPTAASETLFYAPIYRGDNYATMLCTDECEKLGGGEEEEDSLFAGLGELPEFSMVFRRGLAAAASTG